MFLLGTSMNAINLNSDLRYVDTRVDSNTTKNINYDTNDESTIKFLTTANNVNTYIKYDVGVLFIYMLYRRVIINAVDINGKFKLNATSNDILKIQKNDG